MIKLTFTNPYLSILSLPPTELPDFTLITGLNGAGKTHLLQAINGGFIEVDGIGNPSESTKLMDWNSLIPQDEDAYDGHAFSVERQMKMRLFGPEISRVNQWLAAKLTKRGIPQDYLKSHPELTKVDREELAGLLPQQTDQAQRDFRSIFSTASANMMERLKKKGFSEGAMTSMLSQSGKTILEIDEDTFRREMPVNWGTVDIFQQSFATLFVTYRDLVNENTLLEKAAFEGVTDARPLSKEEFEKKYNTPPWDFVNDSLNDAGLDFEIDHPILHSVAPYDPRLTKKSTNKSMQFRDLSSGEKILMSFAICLYYSNDKRQAISPYPSLLLFDEIDSLLHPSMARKILGTITDTLVRENGV